MTILARKFIKVDFGTRADRLFITDTDQSMIQQKSNELKRLLNLQKANLARLVVMSRSENISSQQILALGNQIRGLHGRITVQRNNLIELLGPVARTQGAITEADLVVYEGALFALNEFEQLQGILFAMKRAVDNVNCREFVAAAMGRDTAAMTSDEIRKRGNDLLGEVENGIRSFHSIDRSLKAKDDAGDYRKAALILLRMLLLEALAQTQQEVVSVKQRTFFKDDKVFQERADNALEGIQGCLRAANQVVASENEQIRVGVDTRLNESFNGESSAKAEVGDRADTDRAVREEADDNLAVDTANRALIGTLRNLMSP